MHRLGIKRGGKKPKGGKFQKSFSHYDIWSSVGSTSTCWKPYHTYILPLKAVNGMEQLRCASRTARNLEKVPGGVTKRLGPTDTLTDSVNQSPHHLKGLRTSGCSDAPLNVRSACRLPWYLPDVSAHRWQDTWMSPAFKAAHASASAWCRSGFVKCNSQKNISGQHAAVRLATPAAEGISRTLHQGCQVNVSASAQTAICFYSKRSRVNWGANADNVPKSSRKGRARNTTSYLDLSTWWSFS